MNLTALKQGESAYIVKIIGKGTYRKRLMEMGFSSGTKISVIKKAPFNDPVEYELLGSRIALRNIDAAGIEIELAEKFLSSNLLSDQNLTFENNTAVVPNIKKSFTVAILGNPNCGKTTVFNALTGKNDRIANYSGVTIESAYQEIEFRNYGITIFDLPGLYSLNSITDSDKSIRDFLKEKQPDIILNILDAGNLERNLYLTTDLIDMDVRMVIALNMMDEFNNANKKIDSQNLGILLGFPIVSLLEKDTPAINLLLDKIIAVFEDQEAMVRHIHINYGNILENSIRKVQNAIKQISNYDTLRLYSSRFLAIKLLEKDSETKLLLSNSNNFQQIHQVLNQQISYIEKEFALEADLVITKAKQGFITGALRETLTQPILSVEERNRIADRIFTHRFWGLPIFIAFLWLMFFTTFQLGKIPMGWIEFGVLKISQLVSSALSEGMLKDLLVDGMISGVGGVLIFLPNILLLYFFIAVMEGSGYMSRAVFILDKSMHKIGLHGKSFIPLVMGFGCNVPAIMATRMLENRNERMITMLINPFISCNARLPVYILFATAFFPHYSATILFLIYLLGVVLAILTALLLRKTIFKIVEMPFVMELPPYRLPSVSSLASYMWDRASEYLKKIAGVILIASILFWALSYFPQNSACVSEVKKELIAKQLILDQQLLHTNGVIHDSLLVQKTDMVLYYHNMEKSLQREESYLGQIGKFIEPALRPIGLDWRSGISLISGLTAKEIIVSTLAVLYQVDDDSHSHRHTLASKLQTQKVVDGPRKGEPIFSPLTAFVFMIFVSIYFPCIGSIIAISRESGSAKWGLFSVGYTLSLAWIISFIVYQGGTLLGL
ncbi:MAG: ferrous iron transport protein B [Bacteroidota bacterium]